jgi:hypothetical protein
MKPQHVQKNEINAVMNKLIEEFNPIYVSLTNHNELTGLIDMHPDLEKELDRFEKRWIAWKNIYVRNNRVTLSIRNSAFVDYVAHDIKMRSANAYTIWKEDVQKILDKNTKNPIVVNLNLYKGQNRDLCAFEILVKNYWSVRKLCFMLWCKNTIRQLFKYQPDYPAIQTI